MNYIDYHIKNRVGLITLNRPEKRNALNFNVVAELKEAFTQASQDNTVKVIVLKANGKVFCAGADLAYLQQLQKNTYEENLQDSEHLKSLFEMIYKLNKIVIAQVHGHAIAGGCGLATVCDFVFSAPDARFGYTEVRIGFVPAIVKVFLLRKIGEMRARELLLTGELISADRAVQIGLINKIVQPTELEATVNNFANMLVEKNSEQSMAITKQMIGEVQGMGTTEGLDYAAEMNAKARATDDCKKGIAAFLNKEAVSW